MYIYIYVYIHIYIYVHIDIGYSKGSRPWNPGGATGPKTCRGPGTPTGATQLKLVVVVLPYLEVHLDDHLT